MNKTITTNCCLSKNETSSRSKSKCTGSSLNWNLIEMPMPQQIENTTFDKLTAPPSPLNDKHPQTLQSDVYMLHTIFDSNHVKETV